MIHFCVGSTVFVLAALLSAQTKPADEANSLAHVRNSFVVIVNASYPDTAALFGPSGERVWAGKEWNPQFLYPLPEQDVEGAIFTVQHGSHKSVWVNSIRDVEARHFQYVYFIPDVLITIIDVRFLPVNKGMTKVEVVYTRTALTPDASGHVLALGESDRGSGPEWQQSIDRYLQGRNRAH